MKIVTTLILVLAATCASCKSGGAASPALPCICGTPEADFSGCANELCAKGQRNPDNPDCVCGPMKIGGK